MAEATLSDKLLDDFLTCKICFEIFKEPKILPCLHTFCLKCLNKLQHGSQSQDLCCPICKNKCPIPKNGILDLKNNFYINNLIEIVKTKDFNSPEKTCSFCLTKGENGTAVYRCLDCQDSLCQTCAKRHNYTCLTLKHKVVALEEVRAGIYDDQMRSMQNIKCQIHPKEIIRYFCQTCDVPVCRDCILLVHKTHNCLPAEEAMKTHLLDIRTLLENLDVSLKRYTDVESEADTQLCEIEQNESKIIASISSMTERVIEKVKLEEKEAKQKIRDRFLKPKQILVEQVKKSKRTSDAIRESMNVCRVVMRNGKEVELLYLQDILRKRLEELQNVPLCSVSLLCNTSFPIVQLNDRYKKNLYMFKYSELPSCVNQNPDHLSSQLFDKSNKQQRALHEQMCQTILKSPIEKQSSNQRFAGLKFIKNIDSCWENSIYEPKLTSVAWIDNSKFVVADNSNDEIKIFDINGSLLQTRSVTNPITLTYCDKTVICVSNTHLHLIGDNGHISRKQMTGEKFYPVTTQKDIFIVANIEKEKLHEFSGENSINTIIIRNDDGEVAKLDPFSISVNTKGHIIVSDRYQAKIFTIGKDGFIKHSISCRENVDLKSFWQPGAICIDRYDNIFNAFYKESKVFIFSPEGKELANSNLELKISSPRSLAISGDGKLIVSGSGGYLSLFKIEYAEAE